MLISDDRPADQHPPPKPLHQSTRKEKRIIYASSIGFRKEVETKMTAQKIIDNVTRKLEGVPGIVGVVLGGSRARGTHRPDSDIDIGIYYDESAGFDVARLNEIALRL
ncbi:nucleotidyltransferase domain-containing protein [Laceyella tengchongensis]